MNNQDMTTKTKIDQKRSKKEKAISMLKDERLDTIMGLITERKYITVDELTKKLHYSPATVRRDITQLVKLGYAKKSYGGVCLNEHARPIIIREHEGVPEKERICRKAAELVHDNDTVFIAGSSTTFHLGKYLAKKKDVTVITTDTRLALDLEGRGVRCYLTGGLMKDGMLNGYFAVAALRQMRYDICFFSATGLSGDGEITVVSEEFGMMLDEIFRRSERRVCLCTDAKFGRSAFFSVGTLDKVSCLISNVPADRTLTERYDKTEFLVSDAM